MLGSNSNSIKDFLNPHFLILNFRLLLSSFETETRAQQKRERNAKDAKSVPKSQLKINEAAKTLKCVVCMQTFLQTAREPAVSRFILQPFGEVWEAFR